MKATIIASVMGVLGFGEDGKIAGKVLFPKYALKIADRLVEIELGKAVNEVSALIMELKEKGYSAFVFENPELAQNVRKEMDVETEVEVPSETGESLRGNMGKYAVKVGFLEAASEIARWVHDVSMEMSRIRVKKATEKRDLMIVQAVQTLDDLDKTLNLFMGRLREWYGLHFPELDRLVDKHGLYARLVRNLGKRENFTQENLKTEKISKRKASQLAEAARISMGADLYETDTEQIQTMSDYILKMYDARANLETYVEKIMNVVAPNTSTLAGATLGAKLIASAGGLENLAKMPASTMQVLGAEKALFRSLKTGARPPKHGMIFQHALVHGAERWMRGKVARVFAGRLAIAVRTDAFSGKYIGDRLSEDLQRRIEEIKKKYAKSKRKLAEKRRMKYEDRPRAARKRRKKHGRKD
ncbi:MAG: C/D box methylation guide ribonucleoprotein complex aNOP56 subunit [Candidatus Bathyarchaeota archaeon]|nr:C/D box methylation guide ribonucleoprotein complex aNOP56 subunit [Candidatus Bathyarchaeota archaeon]